jgi:hypothetical protein
MLGLAAPPDLCLPERGSTADVLIYALTPAGSQDPIEGLLRGVQTQLEALADTLITRPVSQQQLVERAAVEGLHRDVIDPVRLALAVVEDRHGVGVVELRGGGRL